MLTDKNISVIHNILVEVFPTLSAWYLYGSQLSGNANKKSDIDIAFLASEAVDNVYRLEVQEKLAQKLNKDIDLVNLADCSEVMCFQIINGGERIYCKDKKEVESFEDKAYWHYLDLQELRKGILDDAKATGQIYG